MACCLTMAQPCSIFKYDPLIALTFFGRAGKGAICSSHFLLLHFPPPCRSSPGPPAFRVRLPGPSQPHPCLDAASHSEG